MINLDCYRVKAVVVTEVLKLVSSRGEPFWTREVRAQTEKDETFVVTLFVVQRPSDLARYKWTFLFIGAGLLEDPADIYALRVEDLVLVGEMGGASETTIASLRSEVGTLALTLAGKVVGESLEDDARARATVDRFIADLEAEAANGANA